ncbi:hypothetical protein ACJX0J_033076, partial [Zea mays]
MFLDTMYTFAQAYGSRDIVLTIFFDGSVVDIVVNLLELCPNYLRTLTHVKTCPLLLALYVYKYTYVPSLFYFHEIRDTRKDDSKSKSQTWEMPHEDNIYGLDSIYHWTGARTYFPLAKIVSAKKTFIDIA